MSGPASGSVEFPVGLVRGAVRGAGALLAGVALLMLGTGLLGSLVGLRATDADFSAAATGLVVAAYFAGFALGSVVVPPMIQRVGHIRVFAALASTASAASLVHAIWVDPATWLVLRLATGACIAGLFVVAESWLAGLDDPSHRARRLGLYMLVSLAGLGGGQLLLNAAPIEGFELFVLASVLVSLALVPVSLTEAVPPSTLEAARVPLRRLTSYVPLGVVTTVVGGLVTGAVYGYGAVYGRLAGLDIAQVSALLASTVLVAAAVQWPLARLVDLVDRRFVIAVACLVAAGAAAGAAMLGDTPAFGPLLLLTSVVAAVGLALYPLSIGHVHDWLEPWEVLGAGSRMVLLNGLGAVSGPLLAAAATAMLGPAAFFELLAVATGGVGTYALYRQARRRRAEHEAAWVPLSGTAVTAYAYQEATAEMTETLAAADDTEELPELEV